MTPRETTGGLRWWALALIVAAPRLLVFPWNENLAGDAVARTWLAHRWLADPHLAGSFAHLFQQFGPLHLYLLALAERLWPSLEHAGRLVSLVCGVATVVPLHALTRRLFGAAAASWAVIGFGLWGLHVQASTTAASEALNLLLVVSAAALLQAWWAEDRRVLLLGAALCLDLACATRYDSWLIVPMAVVAVWWRRRDARTALGFTLAASAFTLPWMIGNWLELGHPLYPFRFIDDFHREWFPREAAQWGEGWYRAMCLVFWPGSALLTLTPLLAIAGMAGLWRAWRTRPETRWLVAWVVVPAVLLTVRAVVFSRFAPLVRFTMKEVALLLPFAWLGAQPVLERLGLGARRAWLAAGVACVVAWPVALGWACFRTEGAWVDTLRAISPTSTNPPRLMAVARWLEGNVTPESGLVVDVDPRGYDDLNVGFFSGVPYERQARRRSAAFEARLRTLRPDFIVRIEGGALERDPRFAFTSDGVGFDEGRFDEVPGFSPPWHVYRRAP